MNLAIQLILIIVLIIFIYNFLNEKDKFQSTDNEGHEFKKKYSLNNQRLESIKRYIDDKQQLLEDVENYNCKTSQNTVHLLNKIKDLKNTKIEKEKTISEYEMAMKNINSSEDNEDTYILKIIKLKKEIEEINNKIEITNNKLKNKYCPELLKNMSTNNFKTSSFLDEINQFHLYRINNLNKDIKKYKSFSDNYSVKREPAISNSLDFINKNLQIKSFNDNAPTIEMMQDTLEFSNKVPPIVSEKEIVRLYPYNFTDFNGNYSINFGNFNYKLIDNRHTIKIEITSNEELPMSENNNVNSIFSNGMVKDLDAKLLENDLNTKSFGNLTVFDENKNIILNFEIVNVFRAELPKFPTTTIFMKIKSKNIYKPLEKPLTEDEKELKYQKIKLLNNFGLKDGGIYLHGNDGQFNLYGFNKLHILSMSPI